MKCNGTVHITGLKPPNGFCEKCKAHPCYVCFGVGFKMIKKECAHFECKDCETDPTYCSRCKQQYRCKKHPINIFELSVDHFYTEFCCKMKICILCRQEIKIQHKCPFYVIKLLNS